MAFDIRIAGTDVHFACEGEQNILDAALKAGIELPYSCRKGVCGNCAAGIEQGDVESRGARGESVPENAHLLCQCFPQTDVTIVPPHWKRFDPNARKTFTVKVFRNQLAAPDVSVLQLRLPAGQRAKFAAGQYLQIALPDGSRRSYSMANAPHQSDMLQLHIRHVAGGQFTQVVPNLKSGDQLQIELPYGSFELAETEAPILCVVGGTGFAPVKSILDDMVKKGNPRPVTLIWGGRDKDGLYLLSAVEGWKKSLPGFTFIPALEDAAQAAELGGFHGRVDQAVRSLASDLVAHEAYCCGSPAMVNAVKKACEERGIPAERFYSDVFVPGPAA